MKYDLIDQRCVVTGASSGIGKEIARNLAYFGARVTLACRDRDKGSETLQELADDSKNDWLTVQQVDLSSQASIRLFARRVLAGGAPVDVLVNCAAVFMTERQLTKDGRETTWATNSLSYFMLTNLLLPGLSASQSGRVVNVSCKSAGKLDLDDLEFENRGFCGYDAYTQSKQANRMLTWGLADRLSSSSISVHACHPGSVRTGLQKRLSGSRRGLRKLIGKPFLKTPHAGSMTPTFVAADPSVHEQTNQFWTERSPTACPFRSQTDAIDRLWARCVEMTATDAK